MFGCVCANDKPLASFDLSAFRIDEKTQLLSGKIEIILFDDMSLDDFCELIGDTIASI